MSCINYNAKVLNVGSSKDMMIYILEVSLECEESQVKKVANIEVEVAKGEQLSLSDDIIIRCWNEGHVISPGLSGQYLAPQAEEKEAEAE